MPCQSSTLAIDRDISVPYDRQAILWHRDITMTKRSIDNKKVIVSKDVVDAQQFATEQGKRWSGLSQATTSRESDKFILRLPDGMRERLSQVAESQGRTMNAVVVGALAEYLENTESLESQLAGIEKAILALTDKVSEQNEAVIQMAKENADKRSVRRPGKG
jgi:predicted DNA-binding protein